MYLGGVKGIGSKHDQIILYEILNEIKISKIKSVLSEGPYGL